MTASSINSTITVVVEGELGTDTASQYAGPIEKVTAALLEREYDIVDGIVDRAVSRYDVDADQVRSILTAAGLSERPAPEPEPEEETVTADDVAAGKLSKGERIAKLEEGQAQILEAIKGLTDLARRHLGASL